MSEFSGRHIAVTGASGGIGQAVCSWLRDRGASTYALDLRPTAHAVAEFVECDVRDPSSVSDAAVRVDRAARAAGGRVDGLVAAAGIAEDDVPAETMPIDVFDRVLAVNLRGVFLAATAFARLMLDEGDGRIVAISSMSGNLVVNEPQRQAAYNASKAGVSALVRSLAVEWGPRGVRVNTVSPGYVATPLNDLKQHMHDRWRERTVVDRFAEPNEIAAAVGYLLSNAAAFCIGTELVVDGGYSLR